MQARWLLLTLGTAVLCGGRTLPAEEPRTFPPYTRPTLIAHRGASFDAPEHTLAAYELALRQGADLIEPDLQITRDGHLVCLHDTTLERTTDVEERFPDRGRPVDGKRQWPVAEFTLAEIQSLDAGSWKGPQFAGARVPSFQQVIELVKGRAGLIPETKAPEQYRQRGQSMEPLLLEALQKNQLDQPGQDRATPVVVQSFSAESLQTLRQKHNCRLPLVYLVTRDPQTPEAFEAIKRFADGIGPNKSLVLTRPQLVADAHSAGLSVTVWTFRSGRSGQFGQVRDEMAHFLRHLRVDALFTDNPDQFPRP